MLTDIALAGLAVLGVPVAFALVFLIDVILDARSVLSDSGRRLPRESEGGK